MECRGGSGGRGKHLLGNEDEGVIICYTKRNVFTKAMT